MVITFLTGIGVLLFGVHIMSSSFEKICGNKIRKTVAKFQTSATKNSLFGMLIVLLLQSSTATVSLVMGLCGASVITLFQAFCLIIGSNVGSALHIVLVAFQEINIIGYFSLLTLIGVFIRLFAKKPTAKNWGMCLCGLGLIFVGLSLMSRASNELSQTQGFIDFFFKINNPFILFCLGLVLSALINSSLGTTAIVSSILTMTPLILSLQNASYIIYAMNIGTCFTLVLIGLASRNRKSLKASLSYLIFNIIGALIFCPLTIFDWVTPCTSFLNNPTFQIIFINIIFNTVTLILTLPLAKPITKLLDKIIPDKKENQESISLTPTLGLVQLNSTALTLFNDTIKNMQESMDYISSSNMEISETKNEIFGLIEKTKTMNGELLKIGGELSESDEQTKRDLNSFFIGIEKTNVNIIKLVDSCLYKNKKVNFTQKQISTILALQKLTNENLLDMQKVINEIIISNGLEDLNIVDNILNNLEEITTIKIKAKKSIVEESVSMEHTMRKYTCFLNVINYFEQITTNLTDIILNITKIKQQ